MYGLQAKAILTADWVHSTRPFLHIRNSQKIELFQELLFHADHAFIVHAITKVIWQFADSKYEWNQLNARLRPWSQLSWWNIMIGLYLATKIHITLSFMLISNTYFNRPAVASVCKSGCHQQIFQLYFLTFWVVLFSLSSNMIAYLLKYDLMPMPDL